MKKTIAISLLFAATIAQAGPIIIARPVIIPRAPVVVKPVPIKTTQVVTKGVTANKSNSVVVDTHTQRIIVTYPINTSNTDTECTDKRKKCSKK